MLPKFNEYREQVNKIVDAVERYELIPGVTDQDIRKVRHLEKELAGLVEQHVYIMTSGMWVVMGNHIDTGEWEIISGPFDAIAYLGQTLLDTDKIPLTPEGKFPYHEICTFKSIPHEIEEGDDEDVIEHEESGEEE